MIPESYLCLTSTTLYNHPSDSKKYLCDLIQFPRKSVIYGGKGKMIVPPLSCHNSRVIQVVKHDDYFSLPTDDVALAMQRHASSNY